MSAKLQGKWGEGGQTTRSTAACYGEPQSAGTTIDGYAAAEAAAQRASFGMQLSYDRN